MSDVKTPLKITIKINTNNPTISSPLTSTTSSISVKVTPTVEELQKKTIPQLKELAKEKSIKVPSSLKKADLVQFIYGSLISKNNISSTGKLFTGTQHDRSKCVPMNMDINKDNTLGTSSRATFLSWRDHFKLKGWAVVPAISSQLASQYRERFWDILEDSNPDLKRNDTKTWTKENQPPNSYGVIRSRFGHTKLQWEAREQVHSIFSDIWGTKDLQCSYDGASLMFPKSEEDGKFAEWFHQDAGRWCVGSTTSGGDKKEVTRNFPDYPAVQGILCLTDASTLEDGGLVVMEDSVKIFDQYLKDHPAEGIVASNIDVNDPLLINKKWLKICAPAGSLILFDSRIVHCNMQPLKDTTVSSSMSRYRMCFYISMSPTKFLDIQDKKKRVELYQNNRMTTHWTHGPWFKALPKDPYLYGRTPKCSIDDKKWYHQEKDLTLIQKSMIGL
ncbi:MAG: lyase [Solumvirus sp.]|uniref:Lyase n=1 Tax=Solumvirus sp. TaxID=2487773 RepID=A0A3G5AHW5_9VIRU|nr:MAG: lyase [Solumvirus sp.]